LSTDLQLTPLIHLLEVEYLPFSTGITISKKALGYYSTIRKVKVQKQKHQQQQQKKKNSRKAQKSKKRSSVKSSKKLKNIHANGVKKYMQNVGDRKKTTFVQNENHPTGTTGSHHFSSGRPLSMKHLQSTITHI